MTSFSPKTPIDDTTIPGFRIAPPKDDDDIWECIICGDDGEEGWIEKHMRAEHKDDVFDEEWARYVRRKDDD